MTFITLVCSFVILMLFSSISNSFKVEKFRYGFKLSKFTSSLNMADKTPLVTTAGKRVEVDGGTSMMAACLKLGLKVPTDCKKGDCGTCTVTVAGQKIRACVGKVPPAPRLKSLKEKGLIVTVDN